MNEGVPLRGAANSTASATNSRIWSLAVALLRFALALGRPHAAGLLHASAEEHTTSDSPQMLGKYKKLPSRLPSKLQRVIGPR